jgi:hypothetical protein
VVQRVLVTAGASGIGKEIARTGVRREWRQGLGQHKLLGIYGSVAQRGSKIQDANASKSARSRFGRSRAICCTFSTASYSLDQQRFSG